MTASVTPNRKCYVVPCVVCEDLYPAHRTDSRTCSSACRVRLHRGHPDRFARQAEMATRMCGGDPVRPFDVRLLDAAGRLRPDLLERVKSGDLEVADVTVHVWHALWSLATGEVADHAS